jgi:hypothetical protein
MQSRRRFLAASAATLAAAALPTGLLAEQLGASVFTNASLGAYTQGLLTQANFQAVAGSQFTLQLPDGSYRTVTLQSVKTLSPTSSAASPSSTSSRVAVAPKISLNTSTQTTTFTLVFDVQGDAIPQGSYLLDHGTLGSFALFVVTGKTDTGTPTLIATFTHLSGAPVTTSAPGMKSYTTGAPTLAHPRMLVP